MIQKRVLVTERLRQPPVEGFSWVDRRFVHDHAPALSRDAILLYFFLAAVCDKHGLSFWSDTTTSGRLKLASSAVAEARDELARRDLLAHDHPLTQVLALPTMTSRRVSSSAGAEALGRILRHLDGARP